MPVWLGTPPPKGRLVPQYSGWGLDVCVGWGSPTPLLPIQTCPTPHPTASHPTIAQGQCKTDHVPPPPPPSPPTTTARPAAFSRSLFPARLLFKVGEPTHRPPPRGGGVPLSPFPSHRRKYVLNFFGLFFVALTPPGLPPIPGWWVSPGTPLLRGLKGGLFPAVGVDRASLSLNFGREPFVYDLNHPALPRALKKIFLISKSQMSNLKQNKSQFYFYKSNQKIKFPPNEFFCVLQNIFFLESKIFSFLQIQKKFISSLKFIELWIFILHFFSLF